MKNRFKFTQRDLKDFKSNGYLVCRNFISEKNIVKIFFDKNSLEFKGWETKDAYSNNVSFIISNLKINKIIDDEFFKIPKEEDL